MDGHRPRRGGAARAAAANTLTAEPVPAPSTALPAASSAPAPAARSPPPGELAEEDEPVDAKLKIDKTPLTNDEKAAGKLVYSHLVLRRDKAALEPLVRRPALRQLVESVDLTVLVTDDAREKKEREEGVRRAKLRKEKERREREREEKEKEKQGMVVENLGDKGAIGRKSDEQKASDKQKAAEAKAAEDKAVEEKLVAEHMATILADVPNVKTVRAVSCDELLHVLLSQSTVRIKSLEIQLVAGDLFRVCAPALSELVDLRCDDIDDDADLPTLRDLTTLHIGSYCAAAAFLSMIAPVRDQLVDLAFPVSSRLKVFDLGSFPSVKHFRVRIQNEPFAAGDTAGIERVVVDGFDHLLGWAVRRLPRLEHLYLEGTLKVRTWDDRISSNPVHLPPRTANILLSLPRDIPHLTLDTNCIRPADAAAFLLDSKVRPSALETLALGGETGRGLCALLRGSENAYTALGGALEKAKIEVTTVR
ncbi:hypothetical protein JCM8208_000937 [Rhodotorula glutinis]